MSARLRQIDHEDHRALGARISRLRGSLAWIAAAIENTYGRVEEATMIRRAIRKIDHVRERCADRYSLVSGSYDPAVYGLGADVEPLRVPRVVGRRRPHRLTLDEHRDLHAALVRVLDLMDPPDGRRTWSGSSYTAHDDIANIVGPLCGAAACDLALGAYRLVERCVSYMETRYFREGHDERGLYAQREAPRPPPKLIPTKCWFLWLVPAEPAKA